MSLGRISWRGTDGVVYLGEETVALYFGTGITPASKNREETEQIGAFTCGFLNSQWERAHYLFHCIVIDDA
jgi:hypothetical protein